jgi:hypothetical protein
MSAQSDDDRIGYKLPPRKTTWKKGQSGNSRKRRKRSESALGTVDKLLFASTPITLNGNATRVTAVEAIVFQLLRQSMSGNARAFRALLRYKKFVSQNMKKKVDLTFVDSAYTQAVARMSKSPLWIETCSKQCKPSSPQPLTPAN